MDSFLLTHRITNFLFDIGCRFTPISIRDQMIRGFLIADRLRHGEHISESKPLLIIGAGAAGATAALVASDNNIPVTLVDKAARPFLKQAGANRYISPTLYDWPAEHWSTMRFPPNSGVPLPLGWKEGVSSRIATTWVQRLFDSERQRELERQRTPNLSPLTIIMSCEVVDVEKLRNAIPNANGSITVNFRDVTSDPTRPMRRFAPKDFSVVVGCSGPGEEICKATYGDFEGIAFWHADSLHHHNYALPEGKSKVLLSGGGDGALQDLIRLLTNCQSPRDVLEALPSKARQSLGSQVRQAEDTFLRSFIWGIANYDCRSNHKLDVRHKQAVNSILDRYGTRLQDALKSLLRPNIEEGAISMVHPCDHFSNCYPVNRTVAHLLVEFIRRCYGLNLVRPFTTVHRVWNPNHSCTIASDECANASHQIQFAAARCQHIKDKNFQPFPNKENPKDIYDLIILRHGVQPSDLFGERPYGNYRQVLPHYVDRDWY